MGLAKLVETDTVGEDGGDESLWRRLRVDRGGEEKSGALGNRLQSSCAVVKSTEVRMRYSRSRTEIGECCDCRWSAVRAAAKTDSSPGEDEARGCRVAIAVWHVQARVQRVHS